MKLDYTEEELKEVVEKCKKMGNEELSDEQLDKITKESFWGSASWKSIIGNIVFPGEAVLKKDAEVLK